MFQGKKSQAGMNFLIIFIGSLIVLSVVSIVIFSTSESITNKGKSKAKSSIQDVGSSLIIIDIIAEDGSDGDLEYWYSSARLVPGSEVIRFAEMIMTFTTGSTRGSYTYNESMNCTNKNHLDGNLDHYGVRYQKVGNENKSGYLTKGDVAKICIKSPTSINQSEEVIFVYIPMLGKIWNIKVEAPNYINDEIIQIFP